jgi:flavin-dependent dehydrogenase
LKPVAVLGGGPAGSMAAAGLAAAGVPVMLLDENLAWEKPCGGGLTYKAYEKYPFLKDNSTPRQFVSEAYLAAHGTDRARLPLSQPLVIYSRRDLNAMLLARAEAAGARVERERITASRWNGQHWTLSTPHGDIEASFAIVATGARNPLRNMGTEYMANDTMYALGYFVPQRREAIDIQFLDRLEGYIWVFPRHDHLSVGICGKGESAALLRQRLERYMDLHGISREGAHFYAHMLPALAAGAWKNNRVAGDGWMAAGDAAGLVDPITGEGLFYAVRSGDFAAQHYVASDGNPTLAPTTYRECIRCEFMEDLAFGAHLAQRVFLGRFLFRSVPERMVDFLHRSQRFCDLMQDLFAGTQDYLSLRNRVLRNLQLRGTVQERVLNFFFRQIIPESSHV